MVEKLKIWFEGQKQENLELNLELKLWYDWAIEAIYGEGEFR